MKKVFYTLIFVSCLLLVGCTTSNKNVNDNKITIGIIQKNIKIGMSSSEVLELLGSPNIITKDKSDEEMWVYDRISNGTVETSQGSGLLLSLFGFSGSRTVSNTNTNLTVIIKFNQYNKVCDFSYRNSSF